MKEFLGVIFWGTLWLAAVVGLIALMITFGGAILAGIFFLGLALIPLALVKRIAGPKSTSKKETSHEVSNTSPPQ